MEMKKSWRYTHHWCPYPEINNESYRINEQCCHSTRTLKSSCYLMIIILVYHNWVCRKPNLAYDTIDIINDTIDNMIEIIWYEDTWGIRVVVWYKISSTMEVWWWDTSRIFRDLVWRYRKPSRNGHVHLQNVPHCYRNTSKSGLCDTLSLICVCSRNRTDWISVRLNL